MSNTATAIAPARLSKAEEEVEFHACGPTDPTFYIDNREWSTGDESAATPELAIALISASPDQRVLKQTDWAKGDRGLTPVRTTIISIL